MRRRLIWRGGRRRCSKCCMWGWRRRGAVWGMVGGWCVLLGSRFGLLIVEQPSVGWLQCWGLYAHYS